MPKQGLGRSNNLKVSPFFNGPYTRTPMEKILALVVSYNRHEKLVQCITSLRQQLRKPDTILVVNNGSSDYTTVWLDQQPDIIQMYQENAGSAGGYYTGISWALLEDYDWIWCLDDDGIAAPDALHQLMIHKTPDILLWNSAILDTTDRRRFIWKTRDYHTIDEVEGDIIDGVAHPFNGTLIHRSVVETAGLPRRDLYYWGEEREYFYRITREYGIRCGTVVHSIIYHPPLQYLHRSEWSCATCWPMYFYIRNRYAVMQSRHGHSLRATGSYFYFVSAFLWAIMLYQRHDRLRKIAFSLWPAYHALKGTYTLNQQQVLASMSDTYQKRPLQVIAHYISQKIKSVFIPQYQESLPIS